MTGNEYEKDFKDKYIPIFKKLYFINRLIYSLVPVKANDLTQKKKVKGLIDNLEGIRNEINQAFKPIIDKLNERATHPEIQKRLAIYNAAIKGLIELSHVSRQKLSSPA